MLRTLVLISTSALALLGCQPAPDSSREATPEDVLAAIPEGEQRQLWEEALKSGKTPPLSELQLPADPVSDLQTPVAPEPADAPPVPSLPPEAQTAIVAVAIPETAYVGEADVVAAGADRIRLTFGPETLDLMYRTPSRRPIVGLAAGGKAQVEVQALADIMPASRYSVAVAAPAGKLALVALLEQSDRPIDRAYRVGAARIRQLGARAAPSPTPPNPDLPAPAGVDLPVEVTIAGRKFTMRSGTVAGPDVTGGPYEVVVYASRAAPAEASYSDTPPFALNAAIFAID